MARLSRLLAAAGTVLVVSLSATADDLFNNTNTGGVLNGGAPPTFLNGQNVHVGQIETYHWNNGRGANPGTISIKSLGGQSYGPFKATGSSGQGGAPNVNWVANVNLTLPIGTYQVIDSDPATWSQNAATHGLGFAILRGERLATTAAVPAPQQQATASRLPPAASPPSPVTPGPATARPLPSTVPAPAPAPSAAAPAPQPAGTIDLFNNYNKDDVQNGPKPNTEVALITPVTVHVTQLQTYHWNGGKGAKPGTLTLKAGGGAVYGPFPAKGVASGNVANANWVADVNLTLTIGTYLLVDSDPSTWSQNATSRGVGFAIIRGTRNVASTVPAPAPTTPIGAAPVIPRPVIPTPAPAAGSGTFTPCMKNAGAIANMAPCSGAVNTKITFQLTRAIANPIKSITFKPRTVAGIAGATSVQFVVAVSGNATAAGSYYEVTAPAGLCGVGNGSWDLFPFDTKGIGQGDIGTFSAICGAGAVPGGAGAPPPTTVAGPAPAQPAPFKPCYTNSGSVANISPCTTVRPGDIVTVQVIQKLKNPIHTVTFKPRQLSAPGATGLAVVVTMTASGTAVGSTYNFALPAQICVSGPGSWDAYPVDTKNTGLGDIGQVNVVCR
ncbi:MAG TPA: hypothetical protein VKR38_03285 [Usitatibacter sp.]|nr:hypothetical protein [Usitatibacter sp.]